MAAAQPPVQRHGALSTSWSADDGLRRSGGLCNLRPGEAFRDQTWPKWTARAGTTPPPQTVPSRHRTTHGKWCASKGMQQTKTTLTSASWLFSWRANKKRLYVSANRPLYAGLHSRMRKHESSCSICNVRLAIITINSTWSFHFRLGVTAADNELVKYHASMCESEGSVYLLSLIGDRRT